MIFPSPILAKPRESGSLSGFDAEARAREIASYRKNPEQRMPVMLPVRQLGGRVQWPAKFL